MAHRDRAPVGAPCWLDLWTSDVEGARSFYARLLGWKAEEPSAEFGGYFMFTRDGVPVAGGMGDMGDMKATDTWKVYLATDDAAKTVESAQAAGAQVVAPPTAVADLGVQAVLVDPAGAEIGVWEAGSFPGLTELSEPGLPDWFELHTRDHAGAVDFYRSVFQLETNAIADTDEFRYTTLAATSGGGELGGIFDASGFLPEGRTGRWSVYFQVADVDAAITELKSLGGTVVAGPEDTPYGRIATVADPFGAEFRLRTPPGA